MASKVKFKVNLKGLNELMKSEEVQGALEEAGKAVAEAAGEDYETNIKTGRYIAFCNVETATEKAKKENLESNTLLKAVGTVGLKTKK